ncbi:MAG TPA: MurT ligase domain-containing protein [Candidatus Dormibacteraeota bacterium]|nr:MurT ligase domain-containing protein [Candidatus Dormibacteraeota bacterium]
MDPALSLAVAAGRLTAATVRRLGRGGGTTLPGRVSAVFDGRVVEKLGARLTQGSLLVTGTNGKTTTASLLRSLTAAAGHRVVANRAGANLVSGLASALVQDGRGSAAPAEIGVFEVDEAVLPAAVEALVPRVVVVTNLFRDQLDRYGELESSAAAIGAGLAALPAAGHVILCGDDPAVAWLGRNLRAQVHYYGLMDPAQGTTTLPYAADARFCPGCGQPFDFHRVYVGHLGEYSCPTGDFKRPDLDLRADHVEFTGLERQALTVSGLGLNRAVLEVPLSGLYNAYNILAATGAALLAGVPDSAIAPTLSSFSPAFGRLERVAVEGRTVHLMLAKNPAGFNEVLRASRLLGGARNYIVAVNDRIADGRDISWIWDVDFELLAAADHVVLTGDRALDMRIRLKYAGLALERMTVAETPAAAVDQALALVPAGEELFVLPTYTAMLDLRAELVRRGYLAPFWEAA